MHSQSSIEVHSFFFPFRLYLCNSPAVRADNLRFKEEGVRDVLKDVFLPWYNAYRFLMQNVERLERVGHLEIDLLWKYWNSILRKLFRQLDYVPAYTRGEGGNIIFGPDPISITVSTCAGVSVGVTLSCLQSISWTGEHILSRLVGIVCIRSYGCPES